MNVHLFGYSCLMMISFFRWIFLWHLQGRLEIVEGMRLRKDTLSWGNQKAQTFRGLVLEIHVSHMWAIPKGVIIWKTVLVRMSHAFRGIEGLSFRETKQECVVVLCFFMSNWILSKHFHVFSSQKPKGMPSLPAPAPGVSRGLDWDGFGHFWKVAAETTGSGHSQQNWTGMFLL